MYPPSGVSPSYNPSPPPDTGVERGGRQEGHPELSLCQVRARRWQGTDRAATRLGLRRAPAPAEPTPRRRGLAVTAWGEVRAGPGDRDRAGWGSRKVADAVTLVPKPCSSARGPHASLDARGLAAAFQLLYGAALQPGRALPSCAHSRLPSPQPPQPLTPSLHSSPFHSHAPRPTRGSCILDSPGSDAEELRASARPSLPPGSWAKTAQNPVLTFVCTAQW